MNDAIALTQTYEVILHTLLALDTNTLWVINLDRLDYALSNQDVYVLETSLQKFRVWVGSVDNSEKYYQSIQQAYIEAVKLALQRIRNAD